MGKATIEANSNVHHAK